MATPPLAFHFVRDFNIIIILKSLADVFLIQHTWNLVKKKIDLKLTVRILAVKHPKLDLLCCNSLLNWSTKLARFSLPIGEKAETIDETRRRMKRFYNYCSQSAAHWFNFLKIDFKKLLKKISKKIV